MVCSTLTKMQMKKRVNSTAYGIAGTAAGGTALGYVAHLEAERRNDEIDRHNLVKNQDKYSFALSCKDFCRWAGVSKNTYETAVKELIERSYLVRKEEGSNVYIFYEMPQNDEVIMIENPAGSVSEKQAFCF